MATTYVPRVADSELTQRLKVGGAVLVEGPRACGKTELARRQSESEVLLDVDQNAREAISVDPRILLEGATPRLIDEWQIEPVIWNHVRRVVDERRLRGQFILTGSSVPADQVTRHTGAGRISRLRLRTMSSFETGFSTGEVSLHALMCADFDGCRQSSVSIGELVESTCRGGWPGDLESALGEAMIARADYLDEICRADISRVDGVSRNPDNVRRLLRSLARNVATSASARTLTQDVAGEARALSIDTVLGYLAALERLLVIESQPAWSPTLRSRSALRKSAKRHFVDPSLAAAALGATPDRLLADLAYFGCLFESLVYRDLSVYARACDAALYHYRDNTNLEVDIIVQNRQGEWCAFEVKLGAGQVDAAARNLLKLCERVDVESVGEPRSLVVVVGSGYGYQRADGVIVLPISALGP